MADISAQAKIFPTLGLAIQQFSQEEIHLLKQKMAQALKISNPILEEALKKDEEYTKLGYFIHKGLKIQKNLRQFISYTEEEWKEKMDLNQARAASAQKRYKDAKKLTNFIDKFFFEDGRSLHLEKRNIRV